LTAPYRSHEELEELPPSRILKYPENCHPRSPPEIVHQDKLFLAENPECLTVEQGKMGGDDGEIEIDLQLPRNDDSSTITNTGTRTHTPCNMLKSTDLRMENDDHRSPNAQSSISLTSESLSLVNGQGVNVPAGSTCNYEWANGDTISPTVRDDVCPEQIHLRQPTRGLISQAFTNGIVNKN
jgi:hypothetical protein